MDMTEKILFRTLCMRTVIILEKKFNYNKNAFQ